MGHACTPRQLRVAERSNVGARVTYVRLAVASPCSGNSLFPPQAPRVRRVRVHRATSYFPPEIVAELVFGCCDESMLVGLADESRL